MIDKDPTKGVIDTAKYTRRVGVALDLVTCSMYGLVNFESSQHFGCLWRLFWKLFLKNPTLFMIHIT